MILQFLIAGKRHAFTVEEARTLHAELAAFFESYVVDRDRLPAPAGAARPLGHRATASEPPSAPAASDAGDSAATGLAAATPHFTTRNLTS